MKKLEVITLPSEPTHDEIALVAFLEWEKDGRQSGRDTFYWNQAENQLRELYRQKAERMSATKAIRPWPPQPVATTAKPASARAVSVKSATAAKRSVKAKASAAPIAAPAPAVPAKRGNKPTRMDTIKPAPASRLSMVHPVVASGKSAKPAASNRASARR